MKRALLVGIDHYPSVGSLSGCVADATAIADLLRSNHDGSTNFSVKLLASEPGRTTLGRDALRQALTQLFDNARDTDLLFFFAGHGGQTSWGADLVTQDATGN